jgi:hypothetical protein
VQRENLASRTILQVILQYKIRWLANILQEFIIDVTRNDVNITKNINNVTRNIIDVIYKEW